MREDELAWLGRAVELGEAGAFEVSPNPRVGCVVCRDGEVVGEGWHARAGEAHAEVAALARAGTRARGACVYVSLEPCAHVGRTPPCVEALVRAGVARVVAAMRDPDPRVAGAGLAALAAAGVAVRVAPAECAPARAALVANAGFCSRHVRGRPWVRLKIAATLDGKTALGSGLSQWISGEEARRDAHRLRAESCAVATGIGTALQDNPRLTVRHLATRRQPLRVLVDSRCRAGRGMRLFADGNVLVAAGRVAPAAVRALREGGGVEVVELPDAAGRVELGALLRGLARRGVGNLLVEAGGRLNGALLAGGWVDEVVVYFAGKVFGGGGRDMFVFNSPESVAGAPAFARVGLEGFANGDFKVVYRDEAALAACAPGGAEEGG